MSDLSISYRRLSLAMLRGDAVLRAFDIVVALGGLVVFGIPMLVVTAAVWLEGGRPLIFSQTRLGRRGKPFRIHKFRKFRPLEAGGLKLTVEGDVRLTRVGRFIEKTKLDELPQLWNVLVGEMSVVGPRPEVPEFSDCYNYGCQRLLDFKPGVFGPAQVAFRHERALIPDHDVEQFYRDVLFPAKARLDLAYYPRRSVVSDVAWILRGTLAVVRPAVPVLAEVRRPARAATYEEYVREL